MNKIESAVIHRLLKERQGKATTTLRDTENELTPPLTKLVNDIHELYTQKPAKGYGRFEANETDSPTSAILKSHFRTRKLTFIDLSKKLMALLADRASKAPLATGGFVLMAHLSNDQGADWFTVAIITNISASAVDEQTLDVVKAVHVDLQNLRVAGHIDLKEWLSGTPDVRYVSFLKQQGAVAEYFKLFLGCNEIIEADVETAKLVQVIKTFAYNSDLKPAEQDKLLKRAYDFGIERHKNDEPILLEELSNAVYPSKPAALMKAIAESSASISEGFVPNGRVLRTFVHFKARTEFWSIDLQREALLRGKAKYDKKKKTLTLLDLPATLQAELEREV